MVGLLARKRALITAKAIKFMHPDIKGAHIGSRAGCELFIKV